MGFRDCTDVANMYINIDMIEWIQVDRNSQLLQRNHFRVAADQNKFMLRIS